METLPTFQKESQNFAIVDQDTFFFENLKIWKINCDEEIAIVEACKCTKYLLDRKGLKFALRPII